MTAEEQRLLEQVEQLPDVRTDKVAAAKEAIAAGTLDTPANWDKAVGGLIEDVAGSKR